MNDTTKASGMGATAARITIERTYRAKIEALWALWTTKEGFESWWGPEGFRVEVHALEARVGGPLQYDMIADAPEQIQAMKRMGQPTSHMTRGTFTDVRHHERLTITHVIDFLPGVTPYESTMLVQFFPSGPHVRMAVDLSPMHNDQFTQMQRMGFGSQLKKLDARFEQAPA
jgi:uncharacterized protein YndB with AHSA1/START domain